MNNINISLSESMQAYVEEQVATGGYNTASEYFCELVHLDQKRKANVRLEALLVAGLQSGNATPITHKDWHDIKQTVLKATKRQELT